MIGGRELSSHTGSQPKSSHLSYMVTKIIEQGAFKSVFNPGLYPQERLLPSKVTCTTGTIPANSVLLENCSIHRLLIGYLYSGHLLFPRSRRHRVKKTAPALVFVELSAKAPTAGFSFAF